MVSRQWYNTDMSIHKDYVSSQDRYLEFFCDKAKRAPFVLLPGRSGGDSWRVMISAPHSVEQMRNGSIKFGEYDTGVLARLLYDELGCPVIYKTCNCNDDANYDEVCGYKETLKRFITEKGGGIRYLIDLHEMHPRRENLYDLGTGNGRNIEAGPEILDVVKGELEVRGFEHIAVDDIFDAGYRYTVSAFTARECGISCLQVEINSRLLCREYDEYCFETVYLALRDAAIHLNGGNK